MLPLSTRRNYSSSAWECSHLSGHLSLLLSPDLSNSVNNVPQIKCYFSTTSPLFAINHLYLIWYNETVEKPLYMMIIVPAK
jgi:hypothetical protein